MWYVLILVVFPVVVVFVLVCVYDVYSSVWLVAVTVVVDNFVLVVWLVAVAVVVVVVSVLVEVTVDVDFLCLAALFMIE